MLRRLGEYIKSFFWVLWFIFPYVLVAAATSVVLALFNQTTELYRMFAQEPSGNISHIVMALITLVVLTYVIWLVAKDTIDTSREVPVRWAGFTAMSRFWPALIAAALPGAVAWGMYRAAAEDPASHRGDSSRFEGLVDHTLGLTVAGGLLAAYALAVFAVALFGGDRQASPFLQKLTRFKWFPTGFLLFAFLSLLIIARPLDVPRFFGAIAVVLLFSLCLVVFIRFFYNFSPYINAAFILAAAAWIFALTQLDWNSYEVVPAQLKEPATPESTKSAFDNWLRQRNDRNEFSNPWKHDPNKPPYPVFLVAASGGGLYSARHTALTLARIQDNCASFAQHLFAISGISGGSWGAAVFQSLARQSAKNENGTFCDIESGRNPEGPLKKGPLEERAERALDDDFLSPLIAAGLFPNMFQYVLPVSIPRLNRSAVFERMVAQSMADGSAASPLDAPISRAWCPGGSGGALLLNTTDANHGYQVVAAPFSVRSARRQDEKAFMLAQDFMNHRPAPAASAELVAEASTDPAANACLAPATATTANPDGGSADSANAPSAQRRSWTADLRISSGVAMSAGFPVAIGGGSLKDQETKQKMRLVDGGYYENSGVETLLQIIDQLREREEKFEISLHVIILDSHYLSDVEAVSFEPLKAVLAARSVRSQIATTNLYTNRSLTNDLLVDHCSVDSRRNTPSGQNILCTQKCKSCAGARRAGDATAIEVLMCPSEKCTALENSDNPGFNDRLGRLRPFQLSLDLEAFNVPLAFALSHNANRVIDAYSGDSVCDKSKEGASRRQTPVPGHLTEVQRAAVVRMNDRLQCSIDSLCNSFSLLPPHPPEPTAIAEARQPCPTP